MDHILRTTGLGYSKGEKSKREAIFDLETSTEASFQESPETHMAEERSFLRSQVSLAQAIPQQWQAWWHKLKMPLCLRDGRVVSRLSDTLNRKAECWKSCLKGKMESRQAC